VSAESLRWVLGLYCSFIGAFVLVAPHHFSGITYAALQPYRDVWAAAALAAGVGLLAVAVLQPGKLWSVLVHGGAGLTLLVLAASFARTFLWSGAAAYTLFGLGVIAAGWLPYVRPVRHGSGGAGRTVDLFALLMGNFALVIGTAMITGPYLFTASLFDAVRPYMTSLGVAMVLAGALLGWANLRTAPPRDLTSAAHLTAGLVFIFFGAELSFPARAWTGVVLYWGCGAVLALLPWLSQLLAKLDTSSLRTHLAFALAAASTLSLVVTAAIATSQEERLAVNQELEARRIEANAIARNIGDYVQLSATRTFALAVLAGRTPWERAAQQRLLAATRPVYPDVTAFFILDREGSVVAAAGDTLPLSASLLRGLALDVRRQSRREVATRLLPTGEEPLLVFTFPVPGPASELRGVAVMAFDSAALARRIARPGSSIHLADGYGQAIARRELAPEELRDVVGESTRDMDLPQLPAGWDRQVRKNGILATAHSLAAFAVVPDLGWVVAVERPRAAALAGVRRGRDLAFLLLLAVVPLAILVGILVARRIAHPLRSLARATAAMSAGDPAVPLGDSDITEVARLSTSFREMRDRLAERTRESERLAAELRARADALADSDRRKDEFLAMLAHELRNPLGAIANAAFVLDRSGPLSPPAERSVAVIQRQIRHLVRLVDDLLDVSRITRGKVELRRGPVDFRDVVRHAVETTRPVLEERQHRLRLDLPPEPLPLDADVTRLEQVVGNLLRNSARYTEPGGSIEVEVRKAGDATVLAVRDNGIGIAPDLLPRVFDLFTQGEQALDRSEAGLGIGLTLVRSLVEMHGGSVEARSDGPGKGSEFIVRLPLTQEASPASVAEDLLQTVAPVSAQYLPTSPSE
jgi:signal transduction histidine kinase